MKLKKIRSTLYFLGMLFLTFFTSCNNGDYLQEYENYNEFNNIKNPRLTGWFPVALIKTDAHNIKNVSYLSTKCIFGVFDYNNEELYDSIFTEEKYIDSAHYKIFLSQIELTEEIIPNWFPNTDYWKEKKTGVILFDNCYAFKDWKKKQIYYFHPEEESTFVDGEVYPGIRNTIR